MKLELSQGILEKSININFHENPSACNNSLLHADGQTDTPKLSLFEILWTRLKIHSMTKIFNFWMINMWYIEKSLSFKVLSERDYTFKNKKSRQVSWCRYKNCGSIFQTDVFLQNFPTSSTQVTNDKNIFRNLNGRVGRLTYTSNDINKENKEWGLHSCVWGHGRVTCCCYTVLDFHFYIMAGNAFSSSDTLNLSRITLRHVIQIEGYTEKKSFTYSEIILRY